MKFILARFLDDMFKGFILQMLVLFYLEESETCFGILTKKMSTQRLLLHGGIPKLGSTTKGRTFK